MEGIRLTKINSLIEKDHLGDWSPEKDCCLCLTFRQPVRKPYSESSDSKYKKKLIDKGNS